jgi:1-acyl-sn-glycerol-3-phosphate acyltransferase
LYYILIWVARILVFLLTRCKIEGKENIPQRGAFILVSNHLSVSDPVLLGAKIGRKTVFMAKEELFHHRFTGYFVRRFGAFPVFRGRSNRDALREASRILEQGDVLGMFPEGKRSLEDCLQPALCGSALIAYHNRAPVLPVGIIGTEVMWGFGWMWRRPEVTLVIGRPFTLPEATRALTRAQLAEHTETIMQRIAELLPEKYQGEYNTRRDQDEDKKG